MRSVISSGRGTARKYELNGYGLAGKTGTVQVKRISKAEREEGIIDNIDRRWKDRDHALFVGYAPYDKPKYAISVIVEHGGSGSSMAAPIARDILQLHLRDIYMNWTSRLLLIPWLMIISMFILLS